MSAFQCSDFHLCIVARFAAERMAQSNPYIHAQSIAQALADRLKRANIESVNYRYNEKTPRRKCKIIKTDKPFCEIFPLYKPAHVYRLFKCWSYQACEDSNALDFHTLSALLEALFTPEEKEQSKKLDLWAI